jgi:hypothetical protein
MGLAANTQAAEVWTPWTTVSTLYPNSGGLAFMTTYANTSLSNCDGGSRWVIEPTHATYSLLSASLIAAYLAGKQVMLNITVSSGVPCAGVVNRFMVSD